MITIRRAAHPIDHTPLHVFDVPYKRQRISTLVRRYAKNQNVSVKIGHRFIPEDEYRSFRVRDGERIDIVPSVGFLSLFITAATWAKLGFWAKVGIVAADMAIMYGVSYLGGRLLGTDIDESSNAAPPQSMTWAPHTVQQEGIPIPQCFGRNTQYGNLLGAWTDVNRRAGQDDGTSETLYLILGYGEGPVEGPVSGETYLSGQPSSNFSGITLDERLGTLDQSAIFSSHKLEYQLEGYELLSGVPKTFTTPNDFFDDIEFTLEWPQGNYLYTSQGRLHAFQTRYTVEISVKDADSWTTIVDDVEYGNELNPIFKAYSVQAQGYSVSVNTQYDLRFTKITDNSRTRLQTDMRVRSVREVVNTAFKRPGKVLLGITAVDASQFEGGRINIKSLWDDRVVNVYDGSWNIEHSRNRAWIVFHILTQPVISGAGTGGDPYVIESYEGMDPSQIDTAFFYEWAQWCDELVTDGDGGTEPRMTCDFQADQDTDVWSVATQLAKVGRCHLYWKGTTLTGWIDTPVATVNGLVTYKNILENTWRNSWSSAHDLAGRVTVMFRDRAKGDERAALPVYNENAGNYRRRITLEGAGVTSASLATRVGTFALGRNEKIRNLNRFEMDKEGVRLEPGDVIRLSHRTPDWGKAYRVVKAIDSSTVEVDQVPECEAGDTLYLQVFNEGTGDVEVDSYTVDSITLTRIKITTTWDVEPEPGWQISTGDAVLRRVIKNAWLSDHRFEITCETYDGTIENTDDTDPTLITPNYVFARPGRNLMLPPVNRLDVANLMTRQNLILSQPIITDIPGLGNIEWSGNDVDTIYWEAVDPDEPMHVMWLGDLYEIQGNESTGKGFTTDQFVLFNPNLSAMDGFSTTDDEIAAYAALLTGSWLVCQNIDGVPYPVKPIRVLHAGVIQAGTITARLLAADAITAGIVSVGTNTADADIVANYPCQDAAASTTVVNTEGTDATLAGGDNTITISEGGHSGNCLRLDGSADYINTNQTFQTTFRGSFTVGIRVKPDDGQKALVQVLFGCQSTDTQDYVFVWIDTAGKIKANYAANNNSAVAKTASVVFANGAASSFSHIGVVWDSTAAGVGGIKIFVDGLEQELDATDDGDTSGITFSQYTCAHNPYIGVGNYAGTPTFYFDGPVEDLTIFGRVLTADEMATLAKVDTGDNLLLNHLFDSTYGTMIDGRMLRTGSIEAGAGKIGALAVDTLEIANNAVTIPVSAYTAGSTGYQGGEYTVQSASFTSAGGAIFIHFSIVFQGVIDGGSGGNYYVRLYRDATLLFQSKGWDETDVPPRDFAYSLANTPGAGTYTFYIKVYEDNDITFNVSNRCLLLLETKK